MPSAQFLPVAPSDLPESRPQRPPSALACNGLRRSEVATLAGLSVEYYTRLERGAISGASPQVLESIARALCLDDAERGHLFDLAHAASPSLTAK